MLTIKLSIFGTLRQILIVNTIFSADKYCTKIKVVSISFRPKKSIMVSNHKIYFHSDVNRTRTLASLALVTGQCRKATDLFYVT